MAQWYQVILWGHPVPNPLVADVVDLSGYSEEMFLARRVIPMLPTEPTFRSSKLENDGAPDDVLQAAVVLPLFSRSERFVRAFQHQSCTGMSFRHVEVSEETPFPFPLPPSR